MLVLYVAMKYDYGKREQGHSFEHYNFYHSLLHMGYDIIYFDFMTLMQQHSRQWMNHRLLEVVKAENADLMFTVLFGDELDQTVVREISQNTDTVTLNWFCDDHWRFDNFSSRWAPFFNWLVTTAKAAVPKYWKLGCRNVIKSQWACNHFLYQKMDLPLKYDISFVGKPHGNRRQVIKTLQEAGIKVNVWGSGWELGRVSQEEMIQIFNQSRINLNLTNSSTPVGWPQNKGRRLANRWARRVLTVFSRYRMKYLRPREVYSVKAVETGGQNLNSVRFTNPYPDQIKGRNFEVPGCGGFLLTGWAENLADYYEVGKEVACFDDIRDLITKIKYYLAHEQERATISQMGYSRTMQEHTYAHRFTEIFQKIGVPCHPLVAVMEGNVKPGESEEVS